jgi:hypothetical protein
MKGKYNGDGLVPYRLDNFENKFQFVELKINKKEKWYMWLVKVILFIPSF